MIEEKTLLSLEYDKVLKRVCEYAVLRRTKNAVLNEQPSCEFGDALCELDKTEEAFRLLFDFGISGVEFFDDISDELERAKKGSSLNMAELLRVARLLKSSRIVRNSILAVNDESIKLIPAIAERLYCDQYLEKEITSKILSDEAMSDNASERLAALRKEIKKINLQIREKLNSYIRSSDKYLQDNIVTMRDDRYVIPVKAEYRSQVKGFVHDRSSTGSTVFIEPVEVLELNNKLRMTVSEEALEVAEILRDLSHKISLIADELTYNLENVCEIDKIEAKAIYAYKTKSTRPILTVNKIIDIIEGRHPLIDPKTVVPLNVKVGGDYNFLLITGPNTGGKTVTMKLTGLFMLMAMSGMFLPSKTGTSISIFKNIFCDIGDEQSIEQSLSTFSSHIKNLVHICDNADSDSFVLVDEIGAGTDPDEGSALAQAIIQYFLSFSARGIITTHYSRLKEYALTDKRIMNASMDFDQKTFAPIYKLNIGTPGSSNAIEISHRLGLSETITAEALSLMSDNKISFEKVIKQAEAVRMQSQSELEKYKELTKQLEDAYNDVQKKQNELKAEKERLVLTAKAESRRLVNEKLEEANELVDSIKAILDSEEISSGDLIKARTLRNKLENGKYNQDDERFEFSNLKELRHEDVLVGKVVYVKKLEKAGEIVTFDERKKRVTVLVDGMKYALKESDLFDFEKPKTTNKTKKVIHSFVRELDSVFKPEINVIGLDRNEALMEVDQFIDQAIVNNVEKVSIVHGVGFKVLSTAIHSYLKNNKSVKEFRFGKYGEGENGVTIVTLK